MWHILLCFVFSSNSCSPFKIRLKNDLSWNIPSLLALHLPDLLCAHAMCQCLQFQCCNYADSDNRSRLPPHTYYVPDTVHVLFLSDQLNPCYACSIDANSISLLVMVAWDCFMEDSVLHFLLTQLSPLLENKDHEQFVIIALTSCTGPAHVSRGSKYVYNMN